MSHAKNQAEKIKEISGVNPLKCMKCGKCSATCPAFNEMDIKPHQFVSYVQNGNIGQTGLSPEEIPELLDPEVPQQLLVSAFRRYRR